MQQTSPLSRGQGSNPSFASGKKILSDRRGSLSEPVLLRQETGNPINQSQDSNLTKKKLTARDILDKGNICINGTAGAIKLFTAANKLFNWNLSIGNFLSSSGELITRGAMIGQAGLGLYDGAIEKKNIPLAIAQAMEIGLIVKAENHDKWLLRGISQGLINISSPITKAYEILQKASGNTSEESFFTDYKNLPLGEALKKGFSIPLKIYKNNIAETIKNPSLLIENLTYPLSIASTFMYSGGLLGLTPFKKLASIVRFMGAVPADVIYAFMGHHTRENYDPQKKKYDLKDIFDPKSFLGWAGKFWLPAGIIDPIKRLPFLKSISDPLNDISDASDRIAALFFQLSLNEEKKGNTKAAA